MPDFGGSWYIERGTETDTAEIEGVFRILTWRERFASLLAGRWREAFRGYGLRFDPDGPRVFVTFKSANIR